MRDKLWKKLTVLFLVVSLVIPALPAGAAQEDLKFYGKDGFILTVEDGVTSENLATNKLESLSFSLEYSEDGDELEAEGVDEDDVIVTYKDRKVSNYAGNYTIDDIRFDKPGEVELDVDIEGKTGTEFEGLSDTITIQLNYFNFDVQGAKFYTEFLEDKAITAFGDRIQLKFPKGSYITNTGQSTGPVAPNQEILFAVDEIKDSLNEDENDSTYGYVFLTNSFEISHENDGISAAQPSYPGYITIKYGYDDVLYKSGMISSEVAMYNVTVVKFDKAKDRWIPIGGIVDSKKQTIMAPFDKFGTYAVALNTKTFNDLKDWSKPYVMALAYKGIVEQAADRGDGRLKTDLTSEINRYDFTVMLTKAMNWAPMSYNNYFDDVNPDTVTSEVYGSDTNFSNGDDYIMAAVVNGLLQGELNTSGELEMKPDNYLTREEAAVFATRALKLKVATYDTKNMEKINKDLNKMFIDADTISEWAKPYVQAVAKAKIMTGDEYGFRPHGELLFNEACALIYNIMMRNDLFGK